VGALRSEAVTTPWRWILAAVGVVTLAGLGGAAALWWPRAAPPPTTAASAPGATYIGGRACVTCHREQHELWQGSDHARAMAVADGQTVRGDFQNATFTKDGVTSTFSTRDGRYFVRTDGPDGALREYRIDYTFGVTPLQQYLVEFPQGRYQIPSIAWDARPRDAGGQRWFHLYPRERIDHRDSLHWTGPRQNWNSMCAECHSTNLRRDYRLAEDRFATTWSDVSVACEACHGPGSAHAADPRRRLVVDFKAASAGRWALAPGEGIARRTQPLASRAEVETCGVCHSRRGQVWSDYRHGEPLAQTHRVALLDEGLYHADGQILDEVYEYGSFLQSRMYQAGVTCSNCHDPHSGRLRGSGNGLCAQCHLPAKYDEPGHHFHKAGGDGGRCVSCHMIERTYMGVDARRDHSFRVPRPDLTLRVGAPNGCTDCHKNRSASWAAAAVTRWYGANRRSGWHYADALHAGRTSRADAESQLTRVVADTTIPAIVRATALSLLPPYLGPASLPTLETASRDGDPLVRRAAAAALAALEPNRRLPLGVRLLTDPVRTVRFEALASFGGPDRAALAPAAASALDRAIQEYRQAQISNADRAEAHVSLGSLDARFGRPEAAEEDYRQALRLRPDFIPAYVNLADLYRARGQEDRVVQTLEQALKVDPRSSDAYEAMALSLVRQKRLREAIPMLAKAAALRPDVPRYAYVHAIALHEAGETRQALDALRRAHERHPADRHVLIALTEYSEAAGDRAAARRWAGKLVELSPGDADARRMLETLERTP
jgi:predicted CXXCH cytochrome family protein